jgi:YidC/Oxa1 family membrane protein insertase
MALLKKDRGRTPRNRAIGYSHSRACLSTTRGHVQRSNSHSTPIAEAIPAEAVAPASDALDTLMALAPLQYGDLAALGLAGWSPAGLSSWMLELINVSTGLPWFHTIIAGTVFARLILLPFSIKQLRNSAALAPHQPRLMKLKEELDQAYKSGDKLAVQRVALQQRKVYGESGVSMLPMLMMPFVQLPVTLGMFFGVKHLCTLPLEQFHWSGVSFLPDLTVPNPYYILPISSAVLMNLQLQVRASALCDERFLWLTPFGFYRSAQAIWQRRRIARLRLT